MQVSQSNIDIWELNKRSDDDILADIFIYAPSRTFYKGRKKSYPLLFSIYAEDILNHESKTKLCTKVWISCMFTTVLSCRESYTDRRGISGLFLVD